MSTMIKKIVLIALTFGMLSPLFATDKQLTENDLKIGNFTVLFDNTNGYPMRKSYCSPMEAVEKKNMYNGARKLLKNGSATAYKQDIYGGTIIYWNGDTLIFFDNIEDCRDAMNLLNMVHNYQNN